MTQIGRNDPCPCGSGRKHKLCCGAVAIMPAAPARACGTCTRCCDGWLEGEVRGHRMHPGQPCHFRIEGACSIYAERPQSPCRNFVCAWLAPDSTLPEGFRPDAIGVVAVTTRWRGAPALILVSAGNDPDEVTLAWMRAHAEADRIPFFYAKGGERYGYGPPAFQEEMAAKVARGERLW
ncbi:MAG: SEC-C metal-binding domain-containing protein [Caldimonas sp.]